MDSWEYATLGWFIDDRAGRAVYFWRVVDGESETLRDSDAFHPKAAAAGRDGWELVSVSAPTGLGETWYFKRHV